MKFTKFGNYGYKYIYLSFFLITSFLVISIYESLMKAINDFEQTNLAVLFGFKLLDDRLSNLYSANKLMDSILKIYPENKEYLTFKHSLQ